MTKLRDRWWEASLQLALAGVIVGMGWYFAIEGWRYTIHDPGAWIGGPISAYVLFVAFKRFAATLYRRHELMQRAERLRRVERGGSLASPRSPRPQTSD